MELAGYVASLGIGLLLGLIGGGGSILTMPVLVYLFGLSPLLATSYSLFVVGVISLFGFINNYSKHLVDLRTGLLFGVSSVVTVFFTRHFILPALPDFLFEIEGVKIHTSFLLMVLFALLMIAASLLMIRSRPQKEEEQGSPGLSPLLLAGYGLMVGVITGLLGAGGGFLLIPALILFAKLNMKRAIGTSLMIITLNSFIGVLSDHSILHFDWWLLSKIILIAFVGLLAGLRFSGYVSASQLKKGFGFFVLILGVFMLVSEIIRL